MRHRISVKAVIVDAGRILLPAHRDDAGTYYILPGGGQEPGETLAAALVRECREELDVEVVVGELLGVRDYIARNHEFAATDDAHQVELMFCCTLAAGARPALGTTPDPRQVGVEWLPLADLARVRFYPRRIADLLVHGVTPFGYVGDVN